MLIRKVEFIKLLNSSKTVVRRTFIFVEPLHLANYQIPGLGPVLHVHRSPTNPCEVLAFSKWRTRPISDLFSPINVKLLEGGGGGRPGIGGAFELS